MEDDTVNLMELKGDWGTYGGLMARARMEGFFSVDKQYH